MLNLRPSVGSLKAQIEALRTQILGLSDDPAALAELNDRLNAMQMAADALPATQQALAALQSALEKAVSQEQLKNVATQADLDSLMDMVSSIHMPDVSNFATKDAIAQVQASIPSTADLATHSDVSQVAARIPDVSGFATKDAVSTLSSRIPDVSGLATKTALSTVEAKIPDVSGLATKDALSAINAKIPDVSNLATSASVSALSARIPDVSNLATAASVTALSARIPDVSGLAAKSQVDTLSQAVAAIKVPDPATSSPPPTDLVQKMGTSTRYAREDHTHKARVKRNVVTIAANGYATWTFSEPFENIPVIAHMVQETAGLNRVNVIVTDVSKTSVTIYADRLKNLPVIQPVSGILTAVITGVNSIVTALSGLNLSGGSAQGAKVNLYAAEPTT